MVYEFNLTWNIYIILFYIIFGIIFAIFLCLIYLCYICNVYSEKKNQGNLIAIILRYSLYSFSTILYQPVLLYLFSISSCSRNSENILVHYFFEEITCWSGSHIVHVSFAFFIIVLFVMICVITLMNLFDSRLDFENASAKFIDNIVIFF